ncbi:hypothetical protein DVA86_09820 [Streptomyces armeniacus]|uniref:Uncharacterized protein n=1 Tax=Streptomyces armeniacus TaxID=83291 RepID=A0A345XMN4_9ACTN|nr:hypothetical protein [Streptomyces armeniacus]AXK32900.1 hypothetical protein DVA86_09820 [Streptomyces armeniacus]
MAKNSTPTATVPDTAWLGRGRHLGPDPELDVQRNLIALKAAGVLDDFLELDPAEAARSTALHPREAAADPGPSARRLFEARWRPEEGVTVRAQLTTYEPPARRKETEGVTWVLAAEAEQAWAMRWTSPVTMFWPDVDQGAWNHDTVPDVRLRTANHLPKDDDDLRRRLRDCTRHSWYLHILVHEAMTPAPPGQRPVTAFLPPSLRHRVVEHRATPEQARIADFALKREFNARMPRGGAIVLPGMPQHPDYDPERYTVRSIFLDGSEPAEFLDRVQEFAALPRPLPPDAEVALTRLRHGWHLLTPDEELAHAKRMVTKYAEALESMTQSRDLYKEAAEAAQAALAATPRPEGAPAPGAARPEGSTLGGLTKAFGRFRGPNR